MGRLVKLFNSLTEYNEYLNNGKDTDGMSARDGSHSSYDPSWFGTKDYADAENRMMNGDDESAKKIEIGGNGQSVYKNVHSTVAKPKLVRGRAGFMPSVAAYCAGSSRCMYKSKKQIVKSKTTTIVYNISALGGVSSTEIARAAYNMLKAVLKIEASGVRVNFYISTLAETRNKKFGSVVKIKDSGQYFNFLKMAYPMVHPSMQRRQGFRFREITEGISGYGATIKDVQELKEVVESNTPIKDATYLGFYAIRRCVDENEILNRFFNK